MKKLAIAGVTAVLAVGLAGCTPGNNTGGATFVGAAGGGLAGAALFDGSPIGILGGALLGGVIGNVVGQSMDANDRAQMAAAVTRVPVDEGDRWEAEDTSWTNSKDVHYNVHPVRQTRRNNGDYCREYQTTITIGGKVKQAYGTACRKPDGSWKVVS